MKNKIIAVLLLVALLNVSLVFAASATQTYETSKGGFNVKSSQVSRGKPSNPSPGGIATGEVSRPTGNRYAIIIGISNYAGAGSDLQYCDDDAEEFKTALMAAGWIENRITLLVDGGATRSAIMNAIETVAADAGMDDEVVFFYSGHGTYSGYDIDGDGERRDECIIAYELTSAALIWDGDLKDAFAECASQRMMFYFDSCYSGGMNDLAGPGRLICMACGEKQLSLESSGWQNGQFSYYFVDEGMIDGKADTDKLNGVTFEEAFDYAKANCQRQTPIASDGFTNDMLP